MLFIIVLFLLKMIFLCGKNPTRSLNRIQPHLAFLAPSAWLESHGRVNRTLPSEP